MALFHFGKNGEEYAFGTMRRLLGKLRSEGESSCERMARVVVGLGYLHDPNPQAFSGRDRLYVVSLVRACGVEIDDDVSWGELERIVVDEAEKDARQHEHAQNRP